MNAPNEIREFPDRWEITNPKGREAHHHHVGSPE
jgi:hypothetical protein